MFVDKNNNYVINTGEDLEKFIKEHSADEFVRLFSPVPQRRAGRPPKTESKTYQTALLQIWMKNMSVKEIQERYGVSSSTAYRMKRQANTYEYMSLYYINKRTNENRFSDFILKKDFETEKRKPRSFSLTDTTYNRLLKKKKEMGFYGSLSDFLSYLIDKL